MCLLQASSAIAAESHSAAPAVDPLAGLDLDCTAQPAACAGISASSNAYKDAASWAGDASAEAAAYLTAAPQAVLASHGTWDALVGGSDWQELRQPTEKERESVLGLTNGYEGVRTLSWQYKRQAEEAAAHYLDISVLDLDCSPAAVMQDPYARQECMRSKAVNRYESRSTWPDEQQPEGPEAVQVAAEPQQAASRVISTASVGHCTEAARCRQYFKNPCNSPEGRRQYKNPCNQQPPLYYYKNPANAPAKLEALLPQTLKVNSRTRQELPGQYALSLVSTAAALSMLLKRGLQVYGNCPRERGFV